MTYYYINTDTDALGYSPHAKWIKYDLAFTSGDNEESGAQAFETLKPGDIFFMYVSKCGVAAAGQVSESRAGSSYQGRDRLVYQYTEYTENRIPVDWFLSIDNNPISIADLREIVGWTPPKTLQPITKIDAAEGLLKEIRNRVSRR